MPGLQWQWWRASALGRFDGSGGQRRKAQRADHHEQRMPGGGSRRESADQGWPAEEADVADAGDGTDPTGCAAWLVGGFAHRDGVAQNHHASPTPEQDWSEPATGGHGCEEDRQRRGADLRRGTLVVDDGQGDPASAGALGPQST